MLSSQKNVDTEIPEHSRNAKTQARHRAKRKAYIEEARFSFLFPISRLTRVPQLEETATKLQTALGQFTFEQAAVLLPPLAQIRELEAENHDLHRMLSDTTAGPAAG
ncbi:hypothetical protein B0H13DRAFT_1659876 [Mycena leptocephala]|nr:hypothetical protein B0H13DRAFT_1659876 [Mycena leptocephala]